LTIELLKERKTILEQQLQDAQARVEQAMADINAIGGALQEIVYWENIIEKQSENNKEM